MNLTTLSKQPFIIAGAYALLCGPAILLAEKMALPQAPLHITQLVAVGFCFVASLIYVWGTKGAARDTLTKLAIVSATLSALWLIFVVFVVLTLDLSALD